MATYSDPVEAQLDGATVRCGPLVLLDFKSGPVRLWAGFGDLVAGGETWKGIGNLGAISPITVGSGGVVEELTLTLFGDDLTLAHIREDNEETIDREAEIFDQFFDVRKVDEGGRTVDWATIGDPESWFWGRMGPVTVKIDPPGDNGRRTRTVSVNVQNALVNGARPKNSYFSDRDQRARGDGTDQIFINVAQFANGTAPWPIFTT